jgi:hypothetical protein
MTPSPSGGHVAPHKARFLNMLDAAFNGVLPKRFHDAVVATPGTCSSTTSA